MWKINPYEKGGGAAESLAMLKWGHNMFWGSFYMVAWSFRHIEGGDVKCFHSLKKKRGGGLRKVLPWLEVGGGRKKFGTCNSYFVAPSP